MSECPQQELASIRLIQPTFHSAGYAPCPDRHFCCPSGNYCFSDVNNAPECWQDMYYTFYYSYSWSYSFGIRWFTTTSTYYLNGPTVLAISTPPPPSTAPRTGATEPSPWPSSTFTVALSTETSAASAGSARRRSVAVFSGATASLARGCGGRMDGTCVAGCDCRGVYCHVM